MKWFGGLAAALSISVVIAAFVPVSRLSQTCMACRLTRVDSTCFGLTRSTYFDNECSRWYAEHVESKHDHLWERGTCRYKSSLLGMPMSAGCSPGRYPIRLLSPSTQMRVYQKFKDPMAAKTLFIGLTDEKTHNDRIDVEDDDRGHLTVEAIKKWEAAGFPGDWEAWWGNFHAAHVKEHEEYMAWMKADSDLNFRDWQKAMNKK